jgi:hypothetical protein
VVNDEILIVEGSLINRDLRLNACAKEYFVVNHPFLQGHAVQGFPGGLSVEYSVDSNRASIDEKQAIWVIHRDTSTQQGVQEKL